jgi:uracil-DNA glycosylase family 4
VSERDELVADLAAHGRFLEGLTTIGVPPVAAAPAAQAPAAAAGAPAQASSTVALPAGTEAARGGTGAAGLAAVRADLGDCQRCRLAGGRKTIVFGQGNPEAELMFVGEAPGADEDEQGLAFVGRAGQLLTDIIEKGMKLRRADVFIANVLKCLRYNVPVLLEDGSWERIGRLVRQRYSGRVMSVAEDGTLVARRVVGWHATPLGGRSVYKLSHASSRGRGGKRCVTWLTGDHPVLTRRGWVKAEDLLESDDVAAPAGISRVAEQVIAGTLLGDGSMPRHDAHLQIVHSAQQEEYVRLKAGALSEFSPVITSGASRATKDGPSHPTVTCRTRPARALHLVRERFYPGDGRKHVPPDLRLTPMMAAVWFLDDGHTKTRSEGLALSEIAAHSFVGDGIGLLVQGMRDELGIEGYIRPSSPGRIQFGSEASLRLSEMVAPYTPPSLRYKLHPRVRDRVSFQPSLYSPGVRSVMFDRVLAQRVDFKGTDKTFYCIDVEETHNFVTSGAVVHNCRPPQNRNPEPDEVLSCQPFLEAQIRAIRPRVLVGLGKFGAHWLLKTAEPITRLRGRMGEWEGIPVMPTYHPAYLLRNPSGKKDVWGDMKVVLRLLGKPVPGE